jgi:hypothetical protein
MWLAQYFPRELGFSRVVLLLWIAIGILLEIISQGFGFAVDVIFPKLVCRGQFGNSAKDE